MFDRLKKKISDLNPKTIEKERKSLTTNMLTMPFMLLGVDNIFFMAAIIGLGRLSTHLELKSFVNFGTAGPFGQYILFGVMFMYVPILAWYFPIYRWLTTGDDKYKQKVADRFNYVHTALKNLFIMYASARIIHFLSLYRNVIIWKDYLTCILPATLIAIVAQYLIALVYLDLLLSGTKLIRRKLYGTEELYRLKQGTRLTITYKIFCLLFAAAVIPLALLIIIIYRLDSMNDNIREIVKFVAMMAGIVITHGLTFITRSIQRPLNALIGKMEILSKGEFPEKSSILYTDEIANLKANFNVMVDQLKEKEELRDTFGKYVSIEIAKQLVESKNVDLGGQEINATILFSDIRNFTPMSEQASAREIVEFLNRYFSYVTRPIMEHNGVINKFIGDAVMAIYTPILGSETHIDDAMHSAAGMREQLEKFNRDFPQYGGVHFGVGLHAGPLVAGNIGTRERLEYTVIGDTVNVASRLESQTKKQGVDILVSEDFYQGLSPEMKRLLRFRTCKGVKVKGKKKALTLYALCEKQPQLNGSGTG